MTRRRGGLEGRLHRTRTLVCPGQEKSPPPTPGHSQHARATVCTWGKLSGQDSRVSLNWASPIYTPGHTPPGGRVALGPVHSRHWLCIAQSSLAKSWVLLCAWGQVERKTLVPRDRGKREEGIQNPSTQGQSFRPGKRTVNMENDQETLGRRRAPGADSGGQEGR